MGVILPSCEYTCGYLPSSLTPYSFDNVVEFLELCTIGRQQELDAEMHAKGGVL